jgi:hypothetical protein
MIGACALAAVSLFIGGAVIGVVAVVSLGIRREERDLSLTSDRNDRVTRSARRLTGASSRIPGVIHEVSLHRQKLLFASREAGTR